MPLNVINSNFPAVIAPLPYNTKGINLGIGIKFVFNEKKDADKDGVADRWDKCPNTPIAVKVDKKGCPIDSDGDGVPDYLDKCPKTPARVKVDKDGCPLDKDGDGVPDYLDKCPKTPQGVKVDKKGCPIDSDGDGVADYKDKCPDTPKASKVDSVGCPIDSDGDGVPDYLDKCPDTPKIAKVDSNGCPIDTDKDGIPDYLDKCPSVAGVAANNGCPEIKKELPKPVIAALKNEVKKESINVLQTQQQQNSLFRKALQGILFDSGTDIIRERSYGILNQVVGVLKYNPTYQIEIQGHTDKEGSVETNKTLSEKRAQRVKKYFISRGIEEKRITTIGYGNMQPATTNNSPRGKALNRRVEFIVSYEEISFY
ncbi:MAG: thrombospondin type 3 repeat-containing protein [Paludibacter sp.]